MQKRTKGGKQKKQQMSSGALLSRARDKSFLFCYIFLLSSTKYYTIILEQRQAGEEMGPCSLGIHVGFFFFLCCFYYYWNLLSRTLITAQSTREKGTAWKPNCFPLLHHCAKPLLTGWIMEGLIDELNRNDPGGPGGGPWSRLPARGTWHPIPQTHHVNPDKKPTTHLLEQGQSMDHICMVIF